MEIKNSFRYVLTILCLAIAISPVWPASHTAFALGTSSLASDSFTDGSEEQEARADEQYQRGTQALDERQWENAVQSFDEVIRLNGARSDGAQYWKAYAQNKLGQREAALGTIAKLNAAFPKSRWLGDAKALEMEIRQSMGQPAAPENQADDDLKLMAINGLLATDADRALPMLEKILNGNQAPKFKERALFVLAQSGSSRAREILFQVARGQSNPDLQLKALNYLGLFGGKASLQTLSEIYASSTDLRIKRQILNSFMVAGDKGRLLAAAKEEKTPELRRDAIHQLGVLGAKDDLWALYQTYPEPELKRSVLNALFICGNTDRLVEVARNEKDPKLRQEAIHWLGVSDSSKSAEVLLSLYQGQSDVSVRRAVIQGLFVQGNAKALIQLASKETDPGMKKEIVGKLAVMRSKEATDYLMEILNK